MWNVLNCFDWILCFKGNCFVYCEVDVSVGIFGMNCKCNYFIDGIVEFCGKWLFIGYGDL